MTPNIPDTIPAIVKKNAASKVSIQAIVKPNKHTILIMEINGFPNYCIYKDGHVENKITGKILKSFLIGGYPHITLCPGQIKKKIHRLLAEHYLSEYKPELYVDHIDCNRQNNNLENLRMVTPLENAHNYKKGNGCITLRPNGKYGVQYNINYKYNYKTFETLDEARGFCKTLKF